MKVVEIALFTDDVPQLCGFFERLLRQKPTYASEEIATFDLDGITLLLHKKGETTDPDFPPGVDHIAFGVRDVEQAVRAREHEGLTPAFGPRRYDWGYSAYYRDFEGRLWELTSGEE